MNLNKFLAALVLALAFSLGSCSGVKTPGSGGGGGGGGSNATVLVTLTAAPLTPPASTNLLSFSVTVAGISLTPSTGSAVNIPLNSSTYTADLTRLQSDSAFVASSVSIPAGTYKSITVSLSNPEVTYCTQTAGNTGCASGSVVTVTGAAAAPQVTTAPFPLTLTTKQTQALAININLQNALTVNAQTQVVSAVNLAASNVLSASTLPPSASSLPSTGELSFIEDVTGVVTSVSGSSVTVKTATRGSFTATANATTVFSPNCTNFKFSLTFASCVLTGQVASLDLLLNSDGTFTLLEYDPLATTTGDWIEGTITAPATSGTQFQLVTNEEVVSTTNSLLNSNLPLASPVTVTLASPQPFLVDSKGFIIPTNAFSTGPTDASVLAPGQTVSVHLTAFNAPSSSTFATATANELYLRFARVTATVVSVSPPNTFDIQSFPTFLALTAPIVVQLSTGAPSTNFDGITSASGLTASQTVSLGALYFGPPTGATSTPTPFSAAKVRVP